jgi:hypothetical protein
LLWSMDGLTAPVNRSKLTDAIKGSGKVSDFKGVFEELEQEGAIAITGREVRLSIEGLNLLGKKLKNSNFEFATQVGVKTANALLKWIQKTENEPVLSTEVSANGKNGQASGARVISYEEFKQMAVEVYSRLNRDYNLNNLVPIYRIRRDIGEQVSRSQFNDLMLELQANDVLQLIGGEMPSLTPDKAEDSIETKLGGMRYYAKML